MIEPLAVAWHAVKKSKVKPTDKVLILGAGPVGTRTPYIHVPPNLPPDRHSHPQGDQVSRFKIHSGHN